MPVASSHILAPADLGDAAGYGITLLIQPPPAGHRKFQELDHAVDLLLYRAPQRSLRSNLEGIRRDRAELFFISRSKGGRLAKAIRVACGRVLTRPGRD